MKAVSFEVAFFCIRFAFVIARSEATKQSLINDYKAYHFVLLWNDKYILKYDFLSQKKPPQQKRFSFIHDDHTYYYTDR